MTTYQPVALASYFDQLGGAEWTRFERSIGDRVSLELHRETLERFVPRAFRVLDVGAGPGRFTEVLHHIGCRIVVADLSPKQLDENRLRAREHGFASSVEGWHLLDICALGDFADASFDAVVAYGGPLSYVLDRRHQALGECLRVLRPGGLFISSVMSLWGTMHRHLPAVLDLELAQNRAIIETGDLTPSNNPGTGHPCHLFRAAELATFLEGAGLTLVSLSASSALTTGVAADVACDAATWSALLEFERMACVEPGYLDSGTHLIAVCRR